MKETNKEILERLEKKLDRALKNLPRICDCRCHFEWGNDKCPSCGKMWEDLII